MISARWSSAALPVVIPAVVAAALLTACGGPSSPSSTSAGGPAAGDPVATGVAAEPSDGASGRAAPAASAPAAPAPAGVAGCGDVAPIRAALAGSAVTSVAVVGQCTSVVIGTSLPDTGSAVANQLCERAAEVAYTGDVTAVSVLSASKRELSVGIKGAPCLAEP